MKVLFTKAFLETDISYIRKRIDPGIELVIPEDFSEENISGLASDVNVLFGSMITDDILNAAGKLKYIQIPWTGVDNLDYSLLKSHNVKVCNSHSNASVIAEHAVSMMMDCAKKIAYHDRMLRQGDWNRLKNDGSNEVSPFSKMVFGSAIAIIGFGAIGTKIFEMLEGFKCDFKVFDPKYAEYTTSNNNNFSCFPPDRMYDELEGIDFVFVTVPLTDSTRGLIDDKCFSSMKSTAILINISRGPVINEEDLYMALKKRKIASAAMDTWYNYPSKGKAITLPSSKFEFHKLDNMVLSPHRAGYVEGGFPHLDDAIENLNRSNSGRELINIVSLDNQY